MFETSKRDCLPGYTGHIPGKVEEDYVPPRVEPRKQIPGIPKLSQFSFCRVWRLCSWSEE